MYTHLCTTYKLMGTHLLGKSSINCFVRVSSMMLIMLMSDSVHKYANRVFLTSETVQVVQFLFIRHAQRSLHFWGSQVFTKWALSQTSSCLGLHLLMGIIQSQCKTVKMCQPHCGFQKKNSYCFFFSVFPFFRTKCWTTIITSSVLRTLSLSLALGLVCPSLIPLGACWTGRLWVHPPLVGFTSAGTLSLRLTPNSTKTSSWTLLRQIHPCLVQGQEPPAAATKRTDFETVLSQRRGIACYRSVWALEAPTARSTRAATKQSYAGHSRRMEPASTVTSASLPMAFMSCVAWVAIPSTRLSFAAHSTPLASAPMAHAATSSTMQRSDGGLLQPRPPSQPPTRWRGRGCNTATASRASPALEAWGTAPPLSPLHLYFPPMSCPSGLAVTPLRIPARSWPTSSAPAWVMHLCPALTLPPRHHLHQHQPLTTSGQCQSLQTSTSLHPVSQTHFLTKRATRAAQVEV